MKFLVLALCVCAASAASIGNYKPFQPQQQVPNTFGRVVEPAARVVSAPIVATADVAYKAAQIVADAPAVVDAVSKSAQVVAETPVVAARALYNAGQDVYNQGKNVYKSDKESEASIIRSESEVNNDNFQYIYETQNGISAQAYGSTKKVGDETFLTVQGSYRYFLPDGNSFELSYVADENGYRPESKFLPVAPAIPDAIVRSLEFIRSQPARPDNY